MKHIITTMTMCVLLTGATPSIAQESTSTTGYTGGTKQVKATVQDINKDTREVTLKKDDGSTVTVKVPATVQNLDKIKTGDVLTAKYSEAAVISIRKSDEPANAAERETITGGQGTVTARKTMQISGTIEKVDRDTRELTLKGPEGNTKVFKVPEANTKFDRLKEGDEVVVIATESLAVSLSNPEQ